MMHGTLTLQCVRPFTSWQFGAFNHGGTTLVMDALRHTTRKARNWRSPIGARHENDVLLTWIDSLALSCLTVGHCCDGVGHAHISDVVKYPWVRNRAKSGTLLLIKMHSVCAFKHQEKRTHTHALVSKYTYTQLHLHKHIINDSDTGTYVCK